MDKATAREQANRVIATGKAVAFPANLKVYTGGKAVGVDKWLVYARSFDFDSSNGGAWEYLETVTEVDGYLKAVA